ncbi:heterokaryon incompatibility protein Het-C-domain-containing protein, partial [Tricharina praecox]|uniref:heterokaryon incompatibility protein Het-C-domain-containing protein n=1 Tax=Tricharina praecox TaxID=43433 RepID=UPI00221F7C64
MGLTSHTTLFPVLLLCLALYCTPAAAFGAGNIASISKIEGQNWRHGDLEDTLLQLFLAAGAAGGQRRKFSNMDVKRIYFGNWLRDYSQAIDTGALKYVEAETVRILLWVLSFMTFGYATREFEVTAERLGCYRPEEHIDNPKDYNDNNDARDMHSALRGPVDEEVELAIDPETGLKNYIATEGRRLSNVAAQMLRSLFSRSIALGRQYARNGREEDLFEAFRLMGTGLHCIEDFSAHSNYTELALIELGEYDVFPHVGANTMVNVQGREIWPLVTGTFGGVDFLHSVLGEVNDKALQSEISQLEHTISEAQQTGQSDDEQSIIRDLMSKLNIGGKDDIDSKTSELKQKSDAQKEATENGSPFGLSQDAKQLGKDIYPFLEFHDELMRSINQALESVGLDMVMEKLAEAVSVFVFCLLAPYILPVIKQASNELKTGSSEVIASSEAQQHIVFDDDNSSNPTHSMLSKDHFTNLLNEPAGKVASAVLKFAVPLLMNAWDDEGIDPNQVCDEIIGGVFHHPAFRNGEDGRPGVEGRQMMFAVVEEWWSSKDSHQQEDLRAHLSRDGVQQGKNHKAGAHDSGHGCGAPIHRSKPKNRGGDIGGAVGESVGMALENALSGGKKGGDSGLGGMLGSLLGGAISQRLGESGSGGGSGGGQSRSESYSSHQESYSSSRQEYSSYEQTSSYGGGDERSSYSTRESYETPEYSRTTERYRESGREPEEETRYESRREYEPSDQPSWEYDDSGRQDGYMRPERSYEQPERSYEQPERLYGQQQQYSDGRDGGRGRDVEYSYGGERQDYGGG